MTIAECHYDFKMKMDRVDTLSNPDFSTAEIDWLLNEAQSIFIKRRFSALSNPKQKGFEASQKRIDDLSTLVIKYPLQPFVVPTLDSGVYELDLYDLAFPYLHFISGKATIQLPDCEKDIPLRFIQHDDYLVALRDPYNSPSREFLPFNYGRSSSTTHVSTSIYIYPGDYSVIRVYPEYIKEPSRVSYGNYTYIDGVVYPPSDLELPKDVHPEIVDIAVEIASLVVENPEYIRLKQQKVFSNE